MRGLWLEDRRLRVRDDLPVPEPPPGEARIRVTLAGLCHTDLELVRGYYPYAGVLGHEFVGVVDRAPSDAGLGRPPRRRRDQRDVRRLRRPAVAGRSSHCERRTVLGIVNRDGAFAEYLTLPIANLHAVPDAVPDDVAVFTEPVAAAFQILAQVAIDPRDRVVVFGDGKLGQVIAQVLATTGCALDRRRPPPAQAGAPRGPRHRDAGRSPGGAQPRTSSSTAPGAARACRRRSPRCVRAARWS